MQNPNAVMLNESFKENKEEEEEKKSEVTINDDVSIN